MNNSFKASDFNKPGQLGGARPAWPFGAWALMFGTAKKWLLALSLLMLVCALGVPTAHAQAIGSTTAQAKGDKVLIVGDSLSAEYGLVRGKGWVALLQQRLVKDKLGVQLINASISGDTTSGGRSRLPALLRQHQPTVVVIELGANDALRGLPLEMTEQNLRAMTEAAQATGARVLLVGMQVPPNYGRAYSEMFAGLFPKVARATRAALVPFFLKGVADVDNAAQLFQSDRIHPNESAHPIMLANVWPELRKLLK